MPITARTIGRKAYIPEGQEDPKTIFYYEELSVIEQGAVFDLSVKEIDKEKDKEYISARNGTQMVDALRLGLRGWENLVDEDDGTDVQFNPNDMEWNLKQIPGLIAMQIAAKILGGDKLEDEDEKK